MTGEDRIRPVDPERDDLLDNRRPHMRVLGQPGANVGLDVEAVERAVDSPLSHIGGAFAGQIRPDGLAVMAKMAGDRGDRPAPRAERVRVHIILPCEH